MDKNKMSLIFRVKQAVILHSIGRMRSATQALEAMPL